MEDETAENVLIIRKSAHILFKIIFTLLVDSKERKNIFEFFKKVNNINSIHEYLIMDVVQMYGNWIEDLMKYDFEAQDPENKEKIINHLKQPIENAKLFCL